MQHSKLQELQIIALNPPSRAYGLHQFTSHLFRIITEALAKERLKLTDQNECVEWKCSEAVYTSYWRVLNIKGSLEKSTLGTRSGKTCKVAYDLQKHDLQTGNSSKFLTCKIKKKKMKAQDSKYEIIVNITTVRRYKRQLWHMNLLAV